MGTARLRASNVRRDTVPRRSRLPQQIGHIADHFDDDLRDGVLGILREARDAGGDAVVARLIARLIVTISMEFGDAVLDEPLNELADW
jgi:hypothetical protein